MHLNIEDLDRMTPDQERSFLKNFTAQLAFDDGAAAQEHLNDGFPIYYQESTTPDQMCVKEFPDGKKQLVTFDLATGAESVVRDLPA